MPLKLNLGLSRKIGLPDYGSLGASCNVEIELEHTLFEADLDGFHERVRKVYVACRQAVNDELARQQTPDSHAGRAVSSSANGHTSGSGNGSQFATAKQIEYAQQLVRQVPGLGIRRLEAIAHKMHDKPLASLSQIEASALIDVLREAKAGRIDVGQILSGAAA